MSRPRPDPVVPPPPRLRLAAVWTVVAVPLVYGLGQTVLKAAQLLG